LNRCFVCRLVICPVCKLHKTNLDFSLPIPMKLCEERTYGIRETATES
jgi:hypothetical protein